MGIIQLRVKLEIYLALENNIVKDQQGSYQLLVEPAVVAYDVKVVNIFGSCIATEWDQLNTSRHQGVLVEDCSTIVQLESGSWR